MKGKAFFLLSLALLAGCHKNETAKTQPEAVKPAQQIIKVNNYGNLSSLHPHMGVDLHCRIFVKALFEGLTRITPQNIPELAAAESVEISPSKTTYTFTLRPMKWTNGEEVTAYHFEKAWKAALAPDSRCMRSDLYYPIKNAELVKKKILPMDKVGISAPNAKTFVVELEHPAPYFLELVANSLFSPLYDEASQPTVFNGPFHIASWEQDKKMVLEKNLTYWDKNQVTLDQIAVSFVADSTTAMMLYEKGEIDWVGHPFSSLPLDALPRLEHSEQYHRQPIAAYYWLFLNTELFPLHNNKIRLALSTALNRTSLAQHVLLGETPTKSVTKSLFEEEELYSDNNQKRAQMLFEEGLQELHLTLDQFPILIFNHSDISGQKKLAEAIQYCWEKTFGIKVKLQNAEWNVFFANLAERQFQIGGCIWFAVFNDPIYNLEFFKDKSHRFNACQWENTQYRQLLQMADLEIDTSIRREHLKQAALLLLEEMPIIPLFVYNAKYLKSPKIKGMEVCDLGHTDFKWAYIEESPLTHSSNQALCASHQKDDL